LRGVGSSVIAAIKNNRKAVGIDKENEYIKIAEERLNKFEKGELKIREIGTPISEPKK